MMRRYLENLHAREPHEKRRFSLRAAGVITLGVFLVWFSTLGLRIANLSNADTNSASGSDMLAAVGAVGQEVQQGFGQIKANLSVVGGQTGDQQQASTTPPPASAPATALSGSSESTQ